VRSGDNKFVPFLNPGQYVDGETGLAYNRFRYYDVESGRYISQDPIGLAGGMALYGYVVDTNSWVDELGLSAESQARRAREKAQGRHTRNSEYPHGNSAEVHEAVIKANTDLSGNIIDPNTGEIIPKNEVSIEHKTPVVDHWNEKGRFQTKAQRARWYNKKSNLTVKRIGPNKSEGTKMRKTFNQKTGKAYK
jgi:RHS repeat-associated protein